MSVLLERLTSESPYSVARSSRGSLANNRNRSNWSFASVKREGCNP
jgi:hypothetical protein